MFIDRETKERYDLIAKNLVCPDCGNDVDKTTLGALFDKLGGQLEEGEDRASIAYVCTHPDCKYAISIGEKAGEAAA